MKEKTFAELITSVREGGAIMRGEQPAARSFELDAAGVKAVRERFGLSQSEFAALLGINTGTLQNWEQGRRKPRGAAQILLQVAARHPEAVLEVVQSQVSETTSSVITRS